MAIEKYGTIEIYYTDTGSEHPDNARFRKDCENWFGQRVNVLKNEKYRDTWEVFEKHRFLVNQDGAKCTGLLKRLPGNVVRKFGDVEIYGYTREEKHRVKKWQAQNVGLVIECPLIDRDLGKDDCLGIIERVGIEMPVMYRLGFRNNNCIACVKARDNLNYWKRIRKHFPAEFTRMAKLERELHTTINRVTRDGVRAEIYLDEIEPGEPSGPDLQISCGLFCMAEADGLSSHNTDSAQ